MTDRATFLALAARVEAAAGPCVNLDIEIHMAMGHAVALRLEADAAYADVRAVPAVTASLDAAAALVPAWWGWSVNSGGAARCWVRGRTRATAHSVENEVSPLPTPALALCAAALRARAGEVGDE